MRKPAAQDSGTHPHDNAATCTRHSPDQQSNNEGKNIGTKCLYVFETDRKFATTSALRADVQGAIEGLLELGSIGAEDDETQHSPGIAARTSRWKVREAELPEDEETREEEVVGVQESSPGLSEDESKLEGECTEWTCCLQTSI